MPIPLSLIVSVRSSLSASRRISRISFFSISEGSESASKRRNVINIIANPKAGLAAEKFVKEPLESGVDFVRISSDKFGNSAEADKNSARSFIPVDVERPLLDNEQETFLVLESPTFKEGNKWKFYDGQSSFYADMDDPEFLAKIDDGLRFGKGDVLKVTMRNVQKTVLGTIKLERIIVKVQEHKPWRRFSCASRVSTRPP